MKKTLVSILVLISIYSYSISSFDSSAGTFNNTTAKIKNLTLTPGFIARRGNIVYYTPKNKLSYQFKYYEFKRKIGKPSKLRNKVKILVKIYAVNIINGHRINICKILKNYSKRSEFSY